MINFKGLQLDENTSFSVWAQIWLDINKKKNSWSHHQGLLSCVKHLNRYLNNLPISEVRPMHIDNIIADLFKFNPNTKMATSKKTLTSIRNTARQIFEFAIDNGIKITNSAKNIKIPRDAPKEKRDALTIEQVKLILKPLDNRCWIPALIMLFCGLRVGEVIPLIWSDIDVDKKIIFVNKSTQKINYNEYIIKNGTKNKKNRVIAIPDILIDILKSKKQSGLITYKSDGSLHTVSSWRKAWESFVHDLNLSLGENKGINKYSPKKIKKIINVTPHILRHTYATLLYDSDVDLLTASKLMGHSNKETTLKVYTHLDEIKNNISISRFNLFLDQVKINN